MPIHKFEYIEALAALAHASERCDCSGFGQRNTDQPLMEASSTVMIRRYHPLAALVQIKLSTEAKLK